MMKTATKPKRSKPEKPADAGVKIPNMPALPTVPGELREVLVADILDGPHDTENHRTIRVEADPRTKELAASMGEIGLQQPIQVHETNTNAGPRFKVVFGHRRLAAARLLKWRSIPAIVVTGGAADALSHDGLRVRRATENLQRADLNPIEESIAIAELLDDATEKVRTEHGLKDDQEPDARVADTNRREAVDLVAKRLGKTAAWVRDRYFLGTLDAKTRELVITGQIPMGHAHELAKISDPEKRAELADRAAHDEKGEQGMRLDDLKILVAQQVRRLDQVAWKLDVPFANAPACDACPNNSRNQTGLFTTGEKVTTSRWDSRGFKVTDAGVCLNAACFGRKSGASSRQILAGVRIVEATVKGAKPAEREKARRDAITACPAEIKNALIISDDKLRNLVRAKLKDKAEASRGPTTSNRSSGRSPRDEATAKLNDAQWRWEDRCAAAVISALKKKPLTAVLVGLALHGKSRDKQRLFALAFNPSWESFTKLADDLPASALEPRRYELRNGGKAVELLAERLEIKLDARPKLADFMPKAAAKDKDAGKKPAKKGAKAKTTGTPFDDEEDETDQLRGGKGGAE